MTRAQHICAEKRESNGRTTIDPALLKELKNKPEEHLEEALSKKQLQQESIQRAKSQPILQRILKTLTRSDKVFREIIFNSEPSERRVALLEDGVLKNFEIERKGKCRMVGAIFKGKIQNLEPGLKAAFVDIGQEKNAFLHYWDALPAANDASIEVVRVNTLQKSKERTHYTIKDIPKLYPIGAEIIVQIIKDQIGTKGPRVSTNIALPGRFIVLMPFLDQCGISQKIENFRERERLKSILQKLTIPEGMGVIIRTVGEGKKIRYFVRDLHLLLRKWEEIQQSIAQKGNPKIVYQEPDIIERTVRDFLTEEIDRVIVDNEEDYQKIVGLVGKISSRGKSKITLFTDNIPVFERFNIERQIEQTFMRRVALPSGGEIIIDETEALTAVDVNTGSHRRQDIGEESQNFIYQVNAEACREIARQLRLRNIGGLIIVDFIDMKSRNDRNKIYDLMSQLMMEDKSRNQVLPISALGIMQITRQRHSQSTTSDMREPCPYCQGRAFLKSPRTMCAEIQRKIISTVKYLRQQRGQQERIDIRIFLHPQVLEYLRSEDEALLLSMEEHYNLQLSFCADAIFHMENFRILDAKTNMDLR
ncbi:MAG: Rne/Rng family ribonuclease [Puniceicoccales bacterium]|jgi:ribonuclease G|nr:Rne/Rng family ribonuclease [Puniceicoccales bacterium]